jgi:hypothetical protein
MSFLEGVPDTLYKYRSWSNDNHKRVLTHNELYLASASQFNDPYDFSLPFRYRKEDMTPENIFLKLLEVGRREFGAISAEELHRRCYERQMSGAFDDGNYWKEIHPGFIEMLHSSFGILSLTSKKDNFLMWSHYADSHNGFCVGFDKKELLKPIQGSFGKVIYSSSIPEIGLFDDSLSGFVEIFMTKSNVWEYEDEYRLVKIGASKQSINFNTSSIKEVVLGFKMPEKYKVQIVEHGLKKFNNASFYECRLSFEEFKLELVRIA